MKFDIDQAYLIKALKEIIAAPSPVGYYVQLNPVLEKMAAELGLEVTYDNRCNAYITLEGEDNSKTVMVGAHADTLGLIIRGIDKDGVIRVRELGGVNYHSLEGETVTVHTRDGREYTGLMACQSHSVHAFPDARSMERDEVHMMVLLDENVHSKAEVNALGIRNGDHVSIEPHFEGKYLDLCGDLRGPVRLWPLAAGAVRLFMIRGLRELPGALKQGAGES